MRRRLFFMLPDIPKARAMLDELLLARVEERYMHFLAKEGTLPDDMPGTGLFLRSDTLHGAEAGLCIGAISGLLAGSLMFIFPPDDSAGLHLRFAVVLVTAIFGAACGSWMAGWAARSIPNSSLEPFRDAIEQRGQVLLIIDLPYRRVTEIKNMIATRHPEMQMTAPDTYLPALS
jgi:hypothetical protein